MKYNFRFLVLFNQKENKLTKFEKKMKSNHCGSGSNLKYFLKLDFLFY